MRILALHLCCMVSAHALSAQTDAPLSGRVEDKISREGLPSATVSIAGHGLASQTDSFGNFYFPAIKTGKIILYITHVSYDTITIQTEISAGMNNSVSILLTRRTTAGDEIVVSASNRKESIRFAPASIQVITSKDLNRFAGSNMNEMFANVLGLEYNRSNVDEININARGLNNVFNVKVFQLNDGRNSMAPASAGVALFNSGTVHKDDVDQMEIILGPQSALYGPNAHNATVNLVTKDPRKYRGITAGISAGTQSQFSSRIRVANAINKHWAYKFTGEYAMGKDFEWYDSVYAGNQPAPVWTGDPHKPPPGLTPFYGPAVAIPERIQDFNFRRFRGEAHVYYTFKDKSDLILSSGGSNFNRLQLTTTGHNQLKDVRYGFLQARYRRPGFLVNLYQSWINLGSVLNIYNYTRDYWNVTHDTRKPLPPDSAELFARRPGNTVTEKSKRLNGDMQFNRSFKEMGLDITAGVSFQLDRPNSKGLTLVDSFQRIRVNLAGAVVQADKKLPWRMRLFGAIRVDHHNYLGTYTTPRVALTKNWNNSHIRFGWGRAIALPSIQQQFAAINRTLYGNGEGNTYIPLGNNIYDSMRTASLKPEIINTWETGFRGAITNTLYVDLSAYYGTSVNFVSPPRTVAGRITHVGDVAVYPLNAGTVLRDTLKGGSFFTYLNYGKIHTYGLDIGVTYRVTKQVTAIAKYSWFGSDITKASPENDANKDGYASLEERSSNTPVHRGSLQLSFDDQERSRWRVSILTRFTGRYDFYSGNQIGTYDGEGARGIVYGGKAANGLDRWYAKNYNWGPLGGFTSFDLSANYLASKRLAFNLGITNLFNSRQLEAVGSPSIGRLIMLEMKIHLDTGE